MTEPSLSVVTIVRNEAHNIEDFFRCIEGIADELIIVDTGSTDTTVERIHEMTQQASFPVHFLEKRFEPFHFGKAKNFAINRARGSYVFFLDADERIDQTFRVALKALLQKQHIHVLQTNRVDELVPHFIDPQFRIFENDPAIRYGEDAAACVDEILQFNGDAFIFDHPLLHFQGKNHLLRRPQRNLFQLELDVDRTPRTRGWLREILRGVVAFYYIFKKIYFTREARKDGRIGLKYALLRAWYKFLVHFFVACKPRQ
ncbi:glycosyltransferase [Candidatus Kaiserbacteria bacterium]|nr:glycosyltransferase [Candidatus Kaiserbacteria bacterium]